MPRAASQLASLLLVVWVGVAVPMSNSGGSPGALLYRLVHADGEPQQLGPASFRVVQGVVSPPLDPPDVYLAEKMLAKLKRLRTYFPTGLDGIPPLDPFCMDRLEPIKFSQFGLARADIRLSRLVVRGLQQFEVKGLEMRMRNGSRIDFDVYFPALEMDALYKASVIFLGTLEYSPEGTVNVVASGVRARGIVTLDITSEPGSEGHFAVTGLRLALDIAGVQLKITGLTPSASIDGVLNSLLNLVSSGLFETIKAQVTGYVSQLILERVNQFLGQYSAVTILEKFVFD